MKVVTRFNFDERQLRTVRAAHGRGGVATRKECQTFVYRAVLSALEDAPDPKPKRVRVKPTPAALEPEVDETAKARATRERLARLYRRSTGDVSGKL